MMKEFDSEELAKYNGENGSPIYIAHQGKVYDISESKRWKAGMHMKRHRAGADLSTDIKAAPHGPEVFEKFSQVGILKKQKASEVEMPAVLSWLLARYPMLRRHPHPMTVHFPIVFMFSTTVFNVLYLITGVKSFELTALHSLGAGIFFTIVTILTGLYTWWLNYLFRPVRAVLIKKRLSPVMLVLAVIAFIWRLRVPDVLDNLGGIGYIYLLLVLSFLPMVTVIGWFGAQLTFPIENE
ncbi:MAG: cytochrome b5 domain-containing protein [Desulfobacterales bacterium]|nr:cytochrome b5 domain-containing protein [Desulfobacterales bacterium]